MKHTVGPWEAHARDYHSHHNGHFALISAGLSIAIVYHAGTEEDQANANLIAAAPELLASLKAVMSFWIGVEAGDEMPAEIFDAATDAIAKAEGRA